MEEQLEQVNLEDKAKKVREQKKVQHSNQRKQQRQDGRQNGYRNGRDRSRNQERPPRFNRSEQQQNRRKNSQQQWYQCDIMHFMSKNSISDLISDINKRCGTLVRLNIRVDNFKDDDSDSEIVVQAYFNSKQSADKCYSVYNDATLDNKVLKATLRYK